MRSKPPGFPAGDESLAKYSDRPDRVYKRNWMLMGETSKRMRMFGPTPAGWPAVPHVPKISTPQIPKVNPPHWSGH